jgi:hypothetical protein
MHKNPTKPRRSGAWEPYIPTLGTHIGCRPGVRNRSEMFNIRHIAEHYQESESSASRQSEHIPSAAKSVFKGSCVVPDIEEQEVRAGRACNSEILLRNRGSLNSNLVPIGTKQPTETPISSASCSIGVLPGGKEAPHVRRRTNADTVIPRDNLSLGLCPTGNTSTQTSCSKRVFFESKSSVSLGPGLIPLGGSTRRTEQLTSGARMRPYIDPEGPYIRVYGNGFAEFLKSLEAGGLLDDEQSL